MPIDRSNGEIIGNLGTEYVVSPLDRWSGTDMFREAYDSAVEAFLASGALMPFKLGPDQVLVQEYPSHNKLAFLFVTRIAGKEHFYPYVFELPPKMVAELRIVGRWGRTH